jgi:hypothetical protein
MWVDRQLGHQSIASESYLHLSRARGTRAPFARLPPPPRPSRRPSRRNMPTSARISRESRQEGARWDRLSASGRRSLTLAPSELRHRSDASGDGCGVSSRTHRRIVGASTGRVKGGKQGSEYYSGEGTRHRRLWPGAASVGRDLARPSPEKGEDRGSVRLPRPSQRHPLDAIDADRGLGGCHPKMRTTAVVLQMVRTRGPLVKEWA